jgi:signal transduction histidine kinase
MLPYTVGSSLGLGLSVDPVPEGIAEIAAMTAVYLATTTVGSRGEDASAQLVTALANAMSYLGFYAAATAVVSVFRRTSRQLDETRDLAQLQGERLAAERERSRQHRLMHDSAIQTLEAVAAGLNSDMASVQAQARMEAARLRRSLKDAPSEEGLDAGLSGLVAEFSDLGLDCELTLSMHPQLTEATEQALLEATREALRNVLKHSKIGQAVISCSQADEGVKVTVRDHGVGFSSALIEQGFGLRQSVLARLDEVGGQADVWAEPGRGTRVTLVAPL